MDAGTERDGEPRPDYDDIRQVTWYVPLESVIGESEDEIPDNRLIFALDRLEELTIGQFPNAATYIAMGGPENQFTSMKIGCFDAEGNDYLYCDETMLSLQDKACEEAFRKFPEGPPCPRCNRAMWLSSTGYVCLHCEHIRDDARDAMLDDMEVDDE